VTVAESALKMSGHYHAYIFASNNSAANSQPANEADNKQTSASMHATWYVIAATAGSNLPQALHQLA